KKERAAPWRPFGFKPEGLRSGARPDRDLLAILAERLEGHDALDLGVDGVVAAHAHAVAGVDLGADLPHQDVAATPALSAVALHAAALPLGITPVARGALSLFVCHAVLLSTLRRRRCGSP